MPMTTVFLQITTLEPQRALGRTVDEGRQFKPGEVGKMREAVLEQVCEEMRRRTSPPSQVQTLLRPRPVEVFIGGGPRELHTNETDLVFLNDHAVHGNVFRATDKIDRASTPEAPSLKCARPASPLGD